MPDIDALMLLMMAARTACYLNNAYIYRLMPMRRAKAKLYSFGFIFTTLYYTPRPEMRDYFRGSIR